MKPTKTTNSKAHEFIISQKNFKANSLWGINVNDSSYIVHSYHEPIACWISGKGWFVTTTKFSPTTSRHTTIAALAIQKYKAVTSKELKELLSA